MKRILLLLSIASFAVSCKDTWSQEDKDAFYQACTEERAYKHESPEQTKAYCDCVFGKMQQKYPSEQDALEHIDLLAKDSDLIKCNDEVLKK